MDARVKGTLGSVRTLEREARAYTSAATADDFEAVRAQLGIRKLDVWGMSYGTYRMTVFAQRHRASCRRSSAPRCAGTPRR